MCELVIEQEIKKIANEYLYNVSSLKNHNYFKEKSEMDSRTKYYKCLGFHFLYEEFENDYIVDEEIFLEWCTRTFLINPIFEYLLNQHNIENEWRFGTTFSYEILSNREYELENFLEFIAILKGEKVGIRYTRMSYSASEGRNIDIDYKRLIGEERIQGFNKLNTIDRVYILNCSGITDEELACIHPTISGMKSMSEEFTVKEFFNRFFSIKEYDIFESVTKIAIKQAKEIIGLSAVPQLLPNNMLNFKETVLDDFSVCKTESYQYKFKEDAKLEKIDERDLQIIKDRFYGLGYCNSIIGNENFAKSFVTSEYLYRTIKDGLSIDYTAVVAGYIKSVEQALYLLYKSAFKGKKKLIYWDTHKYSKKKNNNFDESLPEYRYNPYDVPESEKKQEAYSHNMKERDFGELIRFLRYYEKMWCISEKGKEYVYACLDDFRAYCRNSHFHKHNIDASQYNLVKTIRNNTQVCLFYLLGGFSLLDSSANDRNQLGIIDYSFETLYKKIRQRRLYTFVIKDENDLETVLYYLNNDEDITYDELGTMQNAKLHFLKTSIDKNDVYISDLKELLLNEKYVKENTVCITRNNMPKEIGAIIPKKKK